MESTQNHKGPATTTGGTTAGILSYDDYCQRSYFAALDGLRALAILLVIFHHVARQFPDPLYALHQNGRYGVSLFFIVSGFLICTLFLREERHRGKISLPSFYARRAIRLFPLYYVMLAVQAAAVFGTNLYQPQSVVLFAEKLPSYIFYYSNLLPTATDGPFFFAWSLAVEEQFYLWFGFAIVFLSRRTLILLVTSALVIKVACYNIFGPLDAQAQVYRVIFSYREPLLLGVLLAFALNQRTLYEKLIMPLGRPGIALSLGVLCVAFMALHPMTSATSWDGMLLITTMTLITAAVLSRNHVPFLSNSIVAYYGKVSYGIYLLHYFVLMLAERFIPSNSPMLHFVIGALGTGVLAVISFAVFENPIISYFRRRRAVKAVQPSPTSAGQPAATLAQSGVPG